MDPPPFLPQRIIRIAARLADLPVELVEPVLRVLSLRRLLQLAITPSAISSESRLRGALVDSLSWRSLFNTGDDRRPQRIWTSLCRLALAWGSQDVRQVPFLDNPDLDLCPEELARAHGPDFGPSTVRSLEATFTQALAQILRIPGQHDELKPGLTRALLAAICRFIPSEVLTAIDANDSGELPDPSSLEDGTSYEQPCTSSMLHGYAHAWDAGQLQAFLPHFIHAFDRLNQVKSEQLLKLATLYDHNSRWLKMPLGPQEPAPRDNMQHISQELRIDAQRMLSKMPLRRQVRRTSQNMDWYRFRYSHPALIPTDKALQIFTTSRAEPFPAILLEHARRAVEGLWYMSGHDGKAGNKSRCVRDRKTMQVRHAVHVQDRRADPVPVAELRWLDSFLQCVSWASSHARWKPSVPKPLLEPADYRCLIETEDPRVIAKQLLADFQISKDDFCTRAVFPSLTALYMPPYSSVQTRGVASHMWPELVDEELRKIYWEDGVQKLKRHLAEAPKVPGHEDGKILACDASPDQSGIDAATSKYVAAKSVDMSGKCEQKACYICRLRIDKPHRIFSAMCEPCGEFNLAGSSASLPHNLKLKGRTALVTGSRVNLGYHVVLRLLRCGASVIASTRYPRDAVSRYREEVDSAEWMDRLRVVGADFRTASDAFSLVGLAKSILHEWGKGLDILINNAAQTLTDSVEMEEQAVARETSLKATAMPMLTEGNYEAKVWRGASANNLLKGVKPEGNRCGDDPALEVPEKDESSVTLGIGNLTLGQKSGEQGSGASAIVKRPEPSSWVQSLSDIPYEDVITAHSINTFVPLILIRELLPLMDHRNHGNVPHGKTGHVVNVSSREGLFEAQTKHSAKSGRHVHTNMSKAGLNMITETEASTAWQKYRVCMNTVDPGYMSAAPEFEDAYGGERPLSWEDGAGRVLWPIAIGEGNQGFDRDLVKMGPIWGRFLKHYGAVRVDTRLGRG